MEIITDQEVADLLKVSISSVRRNAAHGPSKPGPGSIDLRLADPIYIGNRRRWDKEKVLALIK